MNEREQCTFRADLMVPNGRGAKRIPSRQCIARVGHADEHEFLYGDSHIFGASFEKRKWVARR